ncbi:MAG: ComEC/Rec2 family competence protein, partial [Planctomycetaceae bacterium]|nr:ComEC/Rec2 family competence protein [Planctomycetaceae bacterium]
MSEAGQQSNQKPNSDPVIRRAVSVRRPAVLAFVAFAMGLCLDRHFDLSLQFWLASTAFLLVVTFGTRLPWARLNRISIFSSLLSVAVAAGLWHHLHWSILPANDIAAYCQEDGLPVRIRGVLAESVEIREAKYGPRIPAWMELDRSTCEFRCDEIEQGSEWVQVSGTLWLTVDGHLVHVGVGDQVEIFGRLTKPSPPRNPGEVDFQDILRSRGWSGFLRVEHPQAVRFLAMQRGAWWSFLRWREGIREAAHRQLAKHLNSENRAVALSVLIGDRTLMTDELRDRFVKSGTMHLLAISGLHVAILVGMVAVLCRGLGLAPKTSALILISVVILYALLTNHRPPVYRATMLAAIALIGSVRGRSLDGINLLSATGLILLVWHPSDLFDLGAQLSFLAVGAILWATKAWPPSNVYVEPDPLTPERSPFVDLLLSGLRVIGRMLLVTTCIWTVTAPLTISTFHVAAPVGMLLNVLLIPFTTVVLGLGYLLLFMGVIFPPFASVVGPVFDGALSLFLAVVRWGELSPGGHLFLAEIPTWWQMGYYACLLGLWLMWGLRPQVRWGFHLLLTWMAIGLVSAFFVSRDELFRCSFLSVGHGLATIIELPSGQTLLYDAGTIGDGTLAERIVERALWSRG